MAAIRFTARRLGGGALLQRPSPAMIPSAAASREGQRRLAAAVAEAYARDAAPPATNPSYSSCRRHLSSSCAAQSPSNTAKQSINSTRPAPWPREELVERLYQIELKKRELFDMLAQVDCRYPSLSKIARDHRKLIYTLFGHVDANPDDPLWSMYQRKKRLNASLRIGVPILCAIGFMAYHEN